MWPKALSQLIEVAPHLTRLIPAADRFLQGRASSDEATSKVLDQISGLRTDLARVSASHESLFRQLNEQSDRLAGILDQAEGSRAAAEAAEQRAGDLERRLSTTAALLAILLPINIIILALTILMLVRH